jgi:hypothetical protein
MGLSRSAYATFRGVHESTGRKAIATGRMVIGAWPRDCPSMTASEALMARMQLPAQA